MITGHMRGKKEASTSRETEFNHLKWDKEGTNHDRPPPPFPSTPLCAEATSDPRQGNKLLL